MADFRKWTLVVMAVLALLIIPTHAVAQSNVTCTTITVTPQLRGEGLTEQVGDILLQCTGNSTAQTANITVYMNQPVTSRILSGSPTIAGQYPSEALLIIDTYPTSSLSQLLCGNYASGAGSGGCLPTSTVYQGVVSGSSVTFYGIPVMPPVTGSENPLSESYRITNVRINANGLNGGGNIPNPAQAAITITSQNSVLINNSFVTVGYVSASLKTAVNETFATITTAATATDLTSPQCTGVTKGPLETLTYSELQGSAFKYRVAATTQNVPGTIYYTESGFEIPIGSVTAGLADWGTRLKAVFNNIPSGVTVYVSTVNVNGSGAVPTGALGTTSSAVLVSSETAGYSSTTGIPAVTSTGSYTGTTVSVPYVALTNVGGSAEAVWEVTNAIPNFSELLNFEVFFTYAGNAVASTSVPGMTVNMDYAPTYTGTVGGVASSTLGIPRFVVTSTAATALNINICQTALLYPYVVNVAGYDTGLAIANTTSDPFGTSPQSGYCTINWYGLAAPAAGYLGSAGYQATAPTATTGFVQPGTVQAWSASVDAPGFDGYVIAVCNFQYAHGFAFVSDLGGRNLAMGYLADVINGNFGVARTAAPRAAEANGQ